MGRRKGRGEEAKGRVKKRGREGEEGRGKGEERERKGEERKEKKKKFTYTSKSPKIEIISINCPSSLP